MGGYGAALFCCTGFFRGRKGLCGRKYFKGDRVQRNVEIKKNADRKVDDLEESSKVFAGCNLRGVVVGAAVEKS